MVEPRLKRLMAITDELFEEFTSNGMVVTDKMISDLWISVSTEDGKEAMKAYIEFCNKFDLLSTKVLGGLRDAFEEFTESKDQVRKVVVELEKKGFELPGQDSHHSPVITIKQTSEKYGIPEQTLYKWFKSHNLKQVNRKSPATFFTTDVESMLIANDALKKYSAEHDETQKKLKDSRDSNPMMSLNED